MKGKPLKLSFPALTSKQSYKGYEFLAGSIIPNYFKHSKALFSISSELEGLHELGTSKNSPNGNL